jgi:hypothetical protein
MKFHENQSKCEQSFSTLLDGQTEGYQKDVNKLIVAYHMSPNAPRKRNTFIILCLLVMILILSFPEIPAERRQK